MRLKGMGWAVAALVLLPADSDAAGWGRRGHGVLTYDAATERVGVNRDIARLMALGDRKSTRLNSSH